MSSSLGKRDNSGAIQIEKMTDDGNYKLDKRKFNRGASQRRSYTNEEKRFVIQLKDKGLSYDEIAQKTGFSRVNMEKWCSQKGREAVYAKTTKWANLGNNASDSGRHRIATSNVVIPREKSLLLQRTISETSDHPVEAQYVQQRRDLQNQAQKPKTKEQQTLHQTLHQMPQSQIRISQAEGEKISQQINNNSSDDEDDDEGDDTDPCHLTLSLVAKEECKKRQLRRSALAAPATQPKPIPTKTPTATTSLRDKRHSLKEDGDAKIGPGLDIKREFARTNHSNQNSDFTMSISDAMLKMDYSAPIFSSNQNNSGIAPGLHHPQRQGWVDMSTTVQATRPVVSNTKFFTAINNHRKKNAKEKGMHTRSRALEALNQSDCDSDQEAEDAEELRLLGE